MKFLESGCQSYLYWCMGGRIINFVHASPSQPSAAVHTYGWHLILNSKGDEGARNSGSAANYEY